MGSVHHILVGIGGNLPSRVGPPIETLRQAIADLSTEILKNVEVSSFYQTRPVPATAQPDFVNCVIVAETTLTARELLVAFQQMEKRLGRKPAERWSARTLDIDLLAWDDSILPTISDWHGVVNDPDPAAFLTEPVVPHPRLHMRAFVLVPLCELMPQWHHPVLGRTAEELLAMEEPQRQQTQVLKISED